MALTQVWTFALIGIAILVIILWWRTKDKNEFYRAVLTAFIWCWLAFLAEWYGICVLGIWYDPTTTAAPAVPWNFLILSFVVGIGLLYLYRPVYNNKIVLLFFVIATAGTEAFFIAMSILSGKWAHRGGWNPYWDFLHIFILLCLLVAIDMLFKKYNVFRFVTRSKPVKKIE